MGDLKNGTALTTSLNISLVDEMKNSYMSYAMSVIKSRALPDVRDGMKPVHRRIVYAMYEGGYTASHPYKKSARVVGDVMGKYHPHGDSAIYDAMVRMAQNFAIRAPLVDGQGNFGSIDGDPAAAMRYTEARMTRLAMTVTQDLVVDGKMEKGNQGFEERAAGMDVVDFVPNYDETTLQPAVLPARFPNVLVNGGSGIAVGMANTIPTHNLGEVIDATLAYIANPAITVEQLMKIMPGPDFPTGGIIKGQGSVRNAYLTGRGSIYIAGVAKVEQVSKNREAIVITELPYAVNKERLVGRIGELVTGIAQDKKRVITDEQRIEGVADIRDESKSDIRIVIELKRDTDPNLVLNKLRKHTDFNTSIGTNITVLNSKGEPKVMGLVEILSEFVAFRRQVIRRRTIYLLEKCRLELGKQVGLFAARSAVDEVVRLIRSSKDAEEARVKLMDMEFACTGDLATLVKEVDPDVDVPETLKLTENQAKAILALRLSSLTGLELEKIAERAREILVEIRTHEEILNVKSVLDGIMCQEMVEVKEKFATPRKTVIEAAGPDDISEDDLIDQKPVVLTLTNQGYVKITPLDAYREQARGGKGRTGMETKDDDFVVRTLVCNTRTPLIFFTTRGIAHVLKAYKLPEAAPNAKGRPIVNFVNLRDGESIATVLAMPEDETAFDNKFMMFVTDTGYVRRNDASSFARINKAGKIAMKLEDENGRQVANLINVMLADESDDIVLATRKGMAVRFSITDVRVFSGRDAIGVRGINLGKDDFVIGSSLLTHFEASAIERDAYLSGGSAVEKQEDGSEKRFELPRERMEAMSEVEQFVLTVTTKGFGKRFSSHDFRTTARGGKGVWVGKFGSKAGDLASCFPVQDEDGVMLVTNGGQMIRIPVKGERSSIGVMGRGARGVKLFDMPDTQEIVGVALVSLGDDEEEIPVS